MDLLVEVSIRPLRRIELADVYFAALIGKDRRLLTGISNRFMAGSLQSFHVPTICKVLHARLPHDGKLLVLTSTFSSASRRDVAIGMHRKERGGHGGGRRRGL